jgi:hypothetical protein
MASGQNVPRSKAEHMAAPTNAAGVKKALANPEPSTHGPERTSAIATTKSAFGGRDGVIGRAQLVDS